MGITGFDHGYFSKALFDYVSTEYSDWAAGKTIDDMVTIVKEVLYPEAASNAAALETFYLEYGTSWGLSPNVTVHSPPLCFDSQNS
ncbi:MAG: hypothetical protein HQK67_10220 [Desulfamplus sp.]|nr:hypothetical protein [Desulfamplus sp.]